MSTWYLHICILGSTIYDPETLSFSNIGTTTCSHQGSGCALFYSPRHKNRPTVFIGGSNDTTFDVCAEVLDYTVNTSTWEKRMYSKYKILYFIENYRQIDQNYLIRTLMNFILFIIKQIYPTNTFVMVIEMEKKISYTEFLRSNSSIWILFSL